MQHWVWEVGITEVGIGRPSDSRSLFPNLGDSKGNLNPQLGESQPALGELQRLNPSVPDPCSVSILPTPYSKYQLFFSFFFVFFFLKTFFFHGKYLLL